MLAAIIANLQNQPQDRGYRWSIDRSGGGSSAPRYDPVDIIGALAAFREIPGEHPVARAARRYKYIGEVLPKVKEVRENREAAAFLIGVDLGRSAAIDEMMEFFDSARAEILGNQAAAWRLATSPVPMPALPPPPSFAPPACVRGVSRGHERGDGALGVILISALVVGAAIAVKKLAAH